MFLGLLSFLVVFVGASAHSCTFTHHACIDMYKDGTGTDECGISGIWENQLQSVMEICCKSGYLYGKYNSAVGLAEDYYPLAGRYTVRGDDCIMGWSVAYKNDVSGNSNSTCSWSGIHYGDEGIIRTHWILASHRTRESFWSTSRVNHDDFHRIC